MIIETIDIEKLIPHPDNYKEHPDQQLDHIIRSIEDHGFYRNVVIAKDNTILAGHGVVLASKKLGIKEVPCIRLDIEYDSKAALKVLTSDNEITNLAKVDDRKLSEILKEILDEDFDLMGTGFDEDQLSALIYTTRPAKEIESYYESDEWIGIADYDPRLKEIKIIVTFENYDDRQEFLDYLKDPPITYRNKDTWKMWYPPREQEDTKSIFFDHG